jgi:hypothetical protein
MIILDENFPESQRQLLRGWRVPIRQIGYEVGRKGMQDDEIITFLLRRRRSTFFTLDLGFYQRRLCHDRYSLGVWTWDNTKPQPLFVACCAISPLTQRPNVWRRFFACHIEDLLCGVSVHSEKPTSSGRVEPTSSAKASMVIREKTN